MLSRFVVLFGALLVLNVAWTLKPHDKQGPYRIILRGIEDCSVDGDENVLIKVYPKMKRANRTMLLIGGKTDFKIAYSDDIKYKLSIDQFSSQGWKENFFQSDFGGRGSCTLFKEFAPTDGERFFQSMKGPNATCPIEPGKYDMEYWTLDIHAMKGVPVFFYNKYKAHFRMFHPDLSGRQVGCLTTIIDVVPETNKG